MFDFNKSVIINFTLFLKIKATYTHNILQSFFKSKTGGIQYLSLAFLVKNIVFLQCFEVILKIVLDDDIFIFELTLRHRIHQY